MTTVYLAMGSNIGDRMDNLRQACARLDKSSDLQIEARSRIYETQSVEGGGPDDFLNACVRVQTSMSPMQLLHCIRHVEYAMGRPQPPRHGPRLIDIDILLFGEETIDTPELQVPHPRMARRAFVLRPLSDVLKGGWVNEYSSQWERQ
jgi:2-amino-4-hydroxy-6-hydroxymethyldihydropteridine diphosphokinase